MSGVPTAERGRAAAVLALVVLVLVALPVSAGARDGCPAGLLTGAGVRSAPGIERSPGLRPSQSPVPACLDEQPVAPLALPTTTSSTSTTTTVVPVASTVAPPPEPRPKVAAEVLAFNHEAPEPPAAVYRYVASTPKVRAAAPAPRPAPPASERSPFVASIPRPSDVNWSVGHVAGNASLALLLVLLLGLPAEVLNASMKARLAGRVARERWRPWAALEDKVNQLPDPLVLVGFGALSALVYSQLDPDLGFDGTSMLFIGALAFALIVVTGVLEAIRIPYLRRRHEVGSHLQMFPKALLVAVILVVVSRVTGFHPGFIFGVTCGLAVSGRLADEDEGRSIAVACTGLLVVAAVAWLAWIPASDAASADHPGTWAVLFDTFLATLWVTGLQVVLFGLVPVKFLYGEKVLRWSRTGWLALYGAAMFLFVQTLFHPSAGEWGGFSDGMMWLLAGSVVVLLAASFAFWLWVRLRTPDPERLLAA
jgi:hypothetical protein